MKTKRMLLLTLLIGLTMQLNFNTVAQELASVELGDAVSVSVQVCGLFHSDRSLWVYLPGDPENVMEFEVSKDVKNFDQVEVGDMITAVYYESVALSLNAPGELPEESDGVVFITPAEGEKPGAVALEVYDISAIIESYDEETGIVTLIGPKGNVIISEVDEGVADSGILVVGETIHARYTQTFAISVAKL